MSDVNNFVETFKLSMLLQSKKAGLEMSYGSFFLHQMRKDFLNKIGLLCLKFQFGLNCN